MEDMENFCIFFAKETNSESGQGLAGMGPGHPSFGATLDENMLCNSGSVK